MTSHTSHTSHASHKASLTTNPLGRPSSAIQALAVEFQDFMHFPDPAPLYATMGAVAANMLPGNPVWLMLIGAPSTGKTQLLETLMNVPGIHSVSSLKGEAVLLSAVGKKDRMSSATGGILRQIGEHGALVIKDFTSMISMPHDALTQTMAALREIYDGKWQRGVGAEGGHVMTWEGKIAMLAACTQVIDQHHAINNDMGERWVYFRYPESDGYGETMRVLQIADPEAARVRMRELVRCFFDALGLEWGEDYPKRKFTLAESNRLAAIAAFSARARSAVKRNNYTREVEDTPQRESPTRLASALAQLVLGMEMIGVDEGERWRVVGKIAMDCMPEVRRKALVGIRERQAKGVESTWDDVQKDLQCSSSTIRRVVEDLEILEVIQRVPGKKMWGVSAWAKAQIEQGWGK